MRSQRASSTIPLETEVNEIKMMLQQRQSSSQKILDGSAGAGAGYSSGSDPEENLLMLPRQIPKEREEINKKLLKLSEEIETMSKFDQEFNQNLYEGIDAEDREKLKNYVGYYTEFRSTIQRETNAIQVEIQAMKDHMEDLNKQLGMLESLEKQLKVVSDLKAKLQKGKLKTMQQ